MNITIGSVRIKVERTKIQNNNLAKRFIEKFAVDSNQKQSINEVYNLTINGSGRYYFCPQLKVIGIYVLGEFQRVETFDECIPELTAAVSAKD